MTVVWMFLGVSYLSLLAADALTFYQKKKMYERRQDAWTLWLDGRLLRTYRRHWKVQTAFIATLLVCVGISYAIKDFYIGFFSLLLCLYHYYLLGIAIKMKRYAEEIVEIIKNKMERG